MVEFNCPHCGDRLYAEIGQVGETHRCPECNGLVRLDGVQPQMTTKQAMVAGGLAALAGFLFGFSDS